MTHLLQGSIPPMLTPLTPTREVDVPALHHLVEVLLKAGSAGIFVLGTTGEGAWLTDAQSRTVVAETLQATGGRAPVLAGVLQPSTPRSLEMLAWLGETAIDAVVAATPYYYSASEHTHLWHFTRLADASPKPVVVYNIPNMTHNPVPVSVVADLSEHPNIIGVKDSSDDWPYFQQLLKIKDARPDFAVVQGAEEHLAASYRAGADGIVAGLSNLAPDVFVAMGQDDADLDGLQARVTHLRTMYQNGLWLACLKYAASLLEHSGETTVGHNEPPTDAGKAAIRALIAEWSTATP